MVMGRNLRTVDKRIGTHVTIEAYRKLNKIAQKLGRTKSDLLKEGIYVVITGQRCGGSS
jgi:predicted DNA-binding protein